MRAFLAGKSCLIRNPSAIRPWQFVLEPLRGYLMLAERLAEDGSRFASGWNFGPADADARPVSWIANELARSWGTAHRGVTMAQITRGRTTSSSWTLPKPRRCWIGVRRFP